MIQALQTAVFAAKELNGLGSTLSPAEAVKIVELLEAIDQLLEGL